MDKIPFNEAARLAGVHLNTLRNWQRSGKLKTAEKVIESGHGLWIVDPVEVTNLASQHVKQTGDNTVNNIGNTNANYEPIEPVQTAPPPPPPAFEQSLAMIRESVVAPLTAVIERQALRLEEQALDIGKLQERIANLEARLAEAREQTPIPPPTSPAAIMAVTASGTVTPAQVLSEQLGAMTPTLERANPPAPAKRGFWSRLLGS